MDCRNVIFVFLLIFSVLLMIVSWMRYTAKVQVIFPTIYSEVAEIKCIFIYLAIWLYSSIDNMAK